MGSKDVSVVFKATDRMSDTMMKMKGHADNLTKAIEACKKQQEEISSKKAEIKLDAAKAKQELKGLERDAKKGVAGSEEAFKKQQMTLDKLGGEYKRLSRKYSSLQREEGKLEKEKQKNLEAISRLQKETTENTKMATDAERQLASVRSKNSNANATRTGALMKGLATAGLGTMLSGAAENYLNTTLTGMFGSTTGGVISGIGGSALSGAAMGSIAGPVGSAVGAAVGGLTGAINALAEKQTRQDDLFRNEVQSLYTSATGDMSGKLENGSAWAAEREMYKRNYASMTDDAAGAKLYRDIMYYGDTTPYDTSAMLGKGMEMLSYGIERENIMEATEMLGNIAMGDTNKFSGLAYAYAQSMNAGALNGQDRRQMVGWGFDPLEYVAKNQGITMAEAMDMMSDGKITSDMLTDALRTATSEGERYHDAVNAMSDTFTGMQGQLESAKKNIEITMGDAYNETRKQGMEQEIEAYNGEMGEKMKEAYAMIGSYEAEMENRHQQSILDALEEANKDIAEKGLEGLEAEKRMWEAYTDAEIAYKNSEEHQKKLAAEKDLVASIQSELVASGDYVAFGEEMANQFSIGWSGAVRQGIQSGLSGAQASAAIADHGSLGQKLMNHVNSAWKQSAVSHPHATGLPRVPYDGYPAILHEGEQVLTRVEAEQRKSFGGVQIAKLADSIIVREEADIERLGDAIARRILSASETYG